MCAPSFSPNPGCVCVCVWGGGRGGGRVDVQARVVYVSVCVCCTHLISFFTLAFVLVNDLSLVSCCSCFGNAYDLKNNNFGLCCRLFLFVVCTCILCLLPCHNRCPFIDVFMYPRWGFWNKPLDLVMLILRWLVFQEGGIILQCVRIMNRIATNIAAVGTWYAV